MSKLPVLIIIPHAGTAIPQELAGLLTINHFDLLIESDPCANQIFNIRQKIMGQLDFNISRLFVDLDSEYNELPPASDFGVIKKITQHNKPIFKDGIFPDDLAIKNILKRYYFPFYETVEKIIATDEIRFILECHTMMPVAPHNALDAGAPRGIINIENAFNRNGSARFTCDDMLAKRMADSLERSFNLKSSLVTRNRPVTSGNLINEFGCQKIPYLKISLSRSLFFNEEYFNPETLTFDQNQIENLRNRFYMGLERFFNKL